MKRILAMIMALMLLCGAALAEVRLSGDVNVRTGPGLDYDTLGTMRKGSVLEFLGRIGTDDRGVAWYYVTDGRTTGWVSSKYAELSGEDVAQAENLSEYCGQPLDEAAAMLGLDEAAGVQSIVARQFWGDAVVLGGEDRVSYIGVRGKGYGMFGVAPGMALDDAVAQLASAGLALTFRSDYGAMFDYRGDTLVLHSAEGIVMTLDWYAADE